MRSYALILALAVLHARAATIPAPESEKKLPIGIDALDDVSLDDNEREQEILSPANTAKDVENNLRNSIPENIPVKIIEEQPVVKTNTLKEDSNDYVPDNDESSNIKRVEIDLKNPGPPQRQEHDSQKPVPYLSFVDKERAVAAIKQSIAESQNIFSHGIQDVTQKFQYYFANNKNLDDVSKNIQNLRNSFDAEVVKLSTTINSYLKPEQVKGTENVEAEVSPGIKEVENRLKTLETSFSYGVGMLSEGVELLSILKEEDEENLKISGKADNENIAVSTGNPPTNPASVSPPNNAIVSNPVLEYLQNLNNSISNSFQGLYTSIQNFWNPNHNQNQNQNPSANSTNQGGFNPINLFQGITLPNIFQNNQSPQQHQEQQQQQQQGTPPAGTQSDAVASPERPNIFQQIQTGFQNFVNPGQPSQQQTQPSQNPITQFFSDVNQGISNLFQARPPNAQQTTQQTSQPNAAASQPAPATPVASEGTNAVPATLPQAEPAKPGKQSEPVESGAVQNAPLPSEPVQNGPIQEIVQNNPIVKGITNAVKKVQGLSNPSKPRDTGIESSASKGHHSGGSTTGDSISRVEEIKSAPLKEQSETIQDVPDCGDVVAEVNKTE